MKDIDGELLQSFIRSKSESLSPRSVRNLITLLSEMWVKAKANKYTELDPFAALTLPKDGLTEEPFLALEEMKLIIHKAAEPYKTFYWILAETGIRCGEACGIPTHNLLFDVPAIKITQKVWHGKVETVKSKKGKREFEISP